MSNYNQLYTLYTWLYMYVHASMLELSWTIQLELSWTIQLELSWTIQLLALLHFNLILLMIIQITWSLHFKHWDWLICIARAETDPEPSWSNDTLHVKPSVGQRVARNAAQRGSNFSPHMPCTQQDLQVTQHRGLVLQTSCRKDWRVTILMKPWCLD